MVSDWKHLHPSVCLASTLAIRKVVQPSGLNTGAQGRTNNCTGEFGHHSVKWIKTTLEDCQRYNTNQHSTVSTYTKVIRISEFMEYHGRQVWRSDELLYHKWYVYQGHRGQTGASLDGVVPLLQWNLILGYWYWWKGAAYRHPQNYIA